MSMLTVIFIISFLFVPAAAEAWGPLTHVYLGSQIVNLGMSVVPGAIYALIKKYKDDFIYGNLGADIIIGRSFQGREGNSHSWDFAWSLLRGAKTKPQKAFAYGYLTHLCADTVVHNLDKTGLPFRHSFLEVKSESIIDKKYRKMLKELNRFMYDRHDVFLEDKLESLFFSFRTNKKIFKSLLVLSRLPNCSPVSHFIDNRFPYQIPVVDIYKFQLESLSRMFELLKNGEDSKVLQENPAKMVNGRALKILHYSLRKSFF